MANVIRASGYRVEVLRTHGADVMEAGLKYIHNDMCYPFHLSLGQYLLALGSGAYDLENTALLMPTVGDAAGGPTLPASSARPWSRRGTPR